MTPTLIKLCSFCQKETKYVPITVRGKRTLKVNFCADCSAEFVYWRDSGTMVTHLYTTVNDKMYRWSVDSFTDGQARLWYVESPGIPGVQPNKNLKLLKSFNEFPYITPQNINEKIKFMLVYL
jgi:hypothetical protein